MKIIPSKKEDFEDIIEIEYQVNKRRYKYESKKQVENILKEFFNKTSFFILKEQNEIIGYISLKKLNNVGEILFIAVKTKYQGKGQGSRLINFAEDYFNKLDCKRIILEVLSSNYDAINFYNYHGFNIIKTYKKGNNIKIVMSKDLK